MMSIARPLPLDSNDTCIKVRRYRPPLLLKGEFDRSRDGRGSTFWKLRVERDTTKSNEQFSSGGQGACEADEFEDEVCAGLVIAVAVGIHNEEAFTREVALARGKEDRVAGLQRLVKRGGKIGVERRAAQRALRHMA